MIKVVCFDLGGVLIRITQRWREAAEYAGVAILADLAPDAHLQDEQFFDDFQAGAIDDEKYLRALATYLGVSLEDSLRVHNHIMVEPYKDVDRIVVALNEAGFVTGCLSNTNLSHWHDMGNSGRFPAHKAIQIKMASHLVRLQKPDPAIFQKFEETVCASRDEIVFFDDSKTNIATAASLGWQANLIDPTKETAPQIVHGLHRCGVQIQLGT
ncbi:MAG: HAD-IA family hydrolase [Chlorobia bacterium]|nr:HAD-IA family hydrolase [Fimbriimonadaceae bacterium]